MINFIIMVDISFYCRKMVILYIWFVVLLFIFIIIFVIMVVFYLVVFVDFLIYFDMSGVVMDMVVKLFRVVLLLLMM